MNGYTQYFDMLNLKTYSFKSSHLNFTLNPKGTGFVWPNVSLANILPADDIVDDILYSLLLSGTMSEAFNKFL